MCGRLILDFFEMWEVQVKKTNKITVREVMYTPSFLQTNSVSALLFIFNINLLRKPLDIAHSSFHIRNLTILLIWHQIFEDIILKSLSIGTSSFCKIMFQYLKIGSVNFFPTYFFFFLLITVELF